MKLYTICKSCKKDFFVKSNASARPDLIKEKGGEEFNLCCSNCKKISKFHVNDVKAKQNTNIAIGGLIISLIVTLALWNILGLFGTITLSIPFIIWQQQTNAVHSFNTYLISRR